MKKLSLWAKNNPVKSRIVIGLAHVFGGINAIFLGLVLYITEFGYSPWLMFSIANLFFLAFFFYPQRRFSKGWFKYSYFRQKLHDFTLVVSGILAFALMCNNFLSLSSPTVPIENGEAKLIVHKDNSLPEAKTKKGFKSELKAESRQLRKNIKKELKELKRAWKAQKQNGNAGFVKALLIMLTIGVAVTLGMLVAALACNLSCSGYEALALIVLILGWGGIVWLGIIAIKNILQKVGKN
ncbi:MAG: hypothetical protein DWQ02_16565 [Bacteroidetes bacterium]|nr:MAG: hypothetical protein DWQ02_16565 [Bacteroidota bacterium]